MTPAGALIVGLAAMAACATVIHEAKQVVNVRPALIVAAFVVALAATLPWVAI